MNTLYVIMMGAASLLTLLYILVLLIAGKKYDYMIEPLDKKEYRLKELYSFGFEIMNIFHHNFGSKSEQKRRKFITVLKGAQYAEYYLQVEYAKRMALTFPIIIFALVLAPIADEPAICPVMLLIAGALYAYMGRKAEKEIGVRSEDLLSGFSDVVSKLALLTNAGMTMRDAWEQVAYSGTGTIYTEMQGVVVNMRDGMSETDAYYEFGNRCILPEIKKFAGTIVQGILKGNKELSAMLTEQSREVWEIKMNLVKRQGDAAVTKLIFPMMIMFIGVIIMVVMPIFSNLGI